MRVQSNSLGAVRAYFISALSGLYDRQEANAIFILAAGHYLGIARERTMTSDSIRISESELLSLYDCAKTLTTGVPVQYVLGEAWFRGVRLAVSPAVLIPRSETEELVELALQHVPHAQKVIDLCTGSGCIALSIGLALKNADVHAVDISESALEVAKANANALGVAVSFFAGDVLKGGIPGGTMFDLVISNPPYVLHSERGSLSPQVVGHEPLIALFPPGDNAIVFYEKIIDFCIDRLAPGGFLFLELNPLTAEEVSQVARKSGIFTTSQVVNDMSGNKRFLIAHRRQ
jgi:release factor glutamine methyltransferase